MRTSTARPPGVGRVQRAQAAAGRHRLQGVAEQVQCHLLKRRSRAEHRRQAGGEIGLERHALTAGLRPHQLQRVREHAVDIDRLALGVVGT